MVFEDVNAYHQNCNLTVEVNPSKFLDTELIREKGPILMQVFHKLNKFPVHWSSEVPIRYKCNAIIEKFIQQNESHPILIKKYGELEADIKILVFLQFCKWNYPQF